MSWVGPKFTLLSNYTETPLSWQKCLLDMWREKGLLLLSEMRCPFSVAFSMRKAPDCMHNSAESLWWPFYWPQTKASARGLLSWTHPSASRPLEDICTSSVLQAQWGLTCDRRNRALPTSSSGADWGRARGSAPVNPCDRRTRRSRSVGWLMCEGSRPLCVGSALLSLCFCMLEGVSTCWSLCMRWNELVSRKSTRKAKHPTHNRHICSQTDRWEKCVLTRDRPHESPIHTVLVYEYRVLMKIRWKTGVELANMLRLSKNLLNGSIMYYKEMGKSSLKHDSSS